MKRHWIVNIILMIMLVGCVTPAGDGDSTSNPPREQTATLPSIEVTETVTPSEPVPTLTPADQPKVEANVTTTPSLNSDTSLENHTPDQIDNEQCELKSLEHLKSLTGLEGKLILQGSDLSSSNWFFWDFASWEKRQLPHSSELYIFKPAVSPNRRWLAYMVSSHPSHDDQLFVVSSNGSVEKQYSLTPSQSTWPVHGDGVLVDWIDNELLIVGYGDRPGAETVSLVLNPFNGEWQSFTSDYPELFTIVKTSPFWGRYVVTLSVFHPSLDLLVYPSYEGLVLWNVIENRAITTFADDNSIAVNEPVWSPDGSSFITDLFTSWTDSENYANRNIFQVFPNGEWIQLTAFSKQTSGDFYSYVWSPDGRSVAFWLIDGSDKSQTRYRLAILEVASHQVTELSVQAYLAKNDYPHSAPVWSPNSQYIAVAAASGDPNEKGQTVIVNLTDEKVYPIGTEVYPAGWMR